MKLQVIIKHPYGKEQIYPACETSKLLCQIIGQKTLNRKHIELIKKLGYTFEVVAQEEI